MVQKNVLCTWKSKAPATRPISSEHIIRPNPRFSTSRHYVLYLSFSLQNHFTDATGRTPCVGLFLQRPATLDNETTQQEESSTCLVGPPHWRFVGHIVHLPLALAALSRRRSWLLGLTDHFYDRPAGQDDHDLRSPGLQHPGQQE